MTIGKSASAKKSAPAPKPDAKPVQAAIPAASAEPAPVTEPAPFIEPVVVRSTPVPSAKPHKGHGCLISFIVVLLIVGFGAAVLFDLPHRLGILPSAAEEELLLDLPDRAAARQILADFEAGRQPTKGIKVFVLHYKRQPYSLAYVVLDQKEGYGYVDTGYDDPISAAFILTAKSKAVESAQIYRVAVEFREKDGGTMFTVTAPVFAIQQYAAKAISKKEFFAQMAGHANQMRVLKSQYEFGNAP